MIPGIDTYCFHRQYGDPYPGLQTDPGVRWDVFTVLEKAAAMGAAGVSVEACYLDLAQPGLLPRLRDALRQHAMRSVVWAWGHPDGLRSGTDPAAEADLLANLAHARAVGATVMRICAGSRRTRPPDWPSHRAALLPVLRRVADAAGERGVVLAVENHIDLLTDELAELVTTIDSPALGVCFDTANQLRMLEDPMRAARILAPLARATHVKNVVAHRGDPRGFGFWPAVRLADGLVDVPEVLRLLRASGYAGLLAFEADYLHPDAGAEEEAAADSLRWLREQVGA